SLLQLAAHVCEVVSQKGFVASWQSPFPRQSTHALLETRHTFVVPVPPVPFGSAAQRSESVALHSLHWPETHAGFSGSKQCAGVPPGVRSPSHGTQALLTQIEPD